jgi:ArsR family transcriptional regulator, arsenate/arsenite/antimonite-responsive transcriptional repressor / arsenate reductase (thioredoxin)
MSDLVRRAAAFAAIAEPARLRIVDLLTIGDRSSSELMAELGMSSNLVAFHLGVLESRGIVQRTRSEADGRRSYVRLVPEAFSTLEPDPVGVSGRVVFVCTANSARSQLAEAIWAQASDIPVASAGTLPAPSINPGALAAAARGGIPMAADASPKTLAEVQHPGDYLISVCDRAHETLRGRDDAHWSIPDPVRIGTPAAFDAVVAELRARIGRVTPRFVAA